MIADLKFVSTNAFDRPRRSQNISKLNRISLEWFDKWPHSKQYIMDRCEIIAHQYINTSQLIGGPTSFRNLDVQENHPDFMKIVKNLWASYNLDGNEIWVVKEKFKNLKKDLRV